MRPANNIAIVTGAASARPSCTPHGITVNNIAPGAVDTPMNEPLKEQPDLMEKLLSEMPLGRMGKPEEIAALALYLASDASDYVTGSTFIIDEGMTRQSGSL